MTLQIVPTSWASWDFKVADGVRALADIDMSCWREKGLLTVEGQVYQVHREGLLSGEFLLEGPGGVLARAEKPSPLNHTFVVHHAGREYTLRRRSVWGRAAALLAGSEEIGSITPRSAFMRKAEADLPQHLPLAVRMFIIWLAVVSWRRDAAAASGG